MSKSKLVLIGIVLGAALPAWSWGGYFVTYPNDWAVLLGFAIYALVFGSVSWAFYGLLHFGVVKLNEWESR